MVSGLNITFAEHVYKNVLKSFPEGENYLRSHFTRIINWPQAVAMNRTFVTLKALLEIKYLKHTVLDETGHSLWEILNPPVFRSLFGFACLKGYPLVPKVRKYMNLLKDHGFANQIILHYEKLQEIEINKTVKRITFDELKGLFIILCVGIFLDSLVF
ncbi:hypothetical protein HHI36_017890 [Cryptolaemus montrouzieri]|uniref:Uncharacterized protein n=1 Tax=Cryptolaemus montrouzieri TaxID=559131 RepID=A0ABD2NNY9_9CUCU